jgi:hypothetical protein
MGALTDSARAVGGCVIPAFYPSLIMLKTVSLTALFVLALGLLFAAYLAVPLT